jgi:mRNA-degrading endonuclease RelE of RelBE toxin-antitoxin system
MKTLLIRRGARLAIRAIAGAADESGRDRCATLEFFKEQKKLRSEELDKLSTLLTRVANNGPLHDTGKFRALKGEYRLYEFKTSGGLRLLCFWDEGSLIVTTHGYLKGAQKAPKHELERAQQLRHDYFAEKQRGELHHAEPRNSTLRRF